MLHIWHWIKRSSTRRNRQVSRSKELIVTTTVFLAQLKTLVSHIIGTAAHVPETLEESSSTSLGTGRRSTTASTRGRGRWHVLGTLPSSTPHSRKLRPRTPARQTEGFHSNSLTNTAFRSHNCIDKTLNVLSIVGSHALLNRPLDLIVDKSTTMNLLQPLRMAMGEQVDVVVAAASLISCLAHKIFSEELGQGLIVEVHPGDHWWRLVRVGRIGKRNLIDMQDLVIMNLISTCTTIPIAKGIAELSKSS
jgi:hypothetical protein